MILRNEEKKMSRFHFDEKTLRTIAAAMGELSVKPRSRVTYLRGIICFLSVREVLSDEDVQLDGKSGALCWCHRVKDSVGPTATCLGYTDIDRIEWHRCVFSRLFEFSVHGVNNSQITRCFMTALAREAGIELRRLFLDRHDRGHITLRFNEFAEHPLDPWCFIPTAILSMLFQRSPRSARSISNLLGFLMWQEYNDVMVNQCITADAEFMDLRPDVYRQSYYCSEKIIYDKARCQQLAYRKNILSALTYCFSALQLPDFAQLVAARLLY